MVRCTGVMDEFYVCPGEHEHWLANLKLNLIEPEKDSVSYFRHTDVDVKNEKRGYIQFMRKVLNPLKSVGLTDVDKYARLYSNLMRRMDREGRYHSKALAKHNSDITKSLKGKQVVVEVTPWPLKSADSYNVDIIPDESGLLS